MRTLALFPLLLVTACSNAGADSQHDKNKAGARGVEPVSLGFEYFPPAPGRKNAIVFDRTNGCLAEVSLPPEFDISGQIIDGKKVDSERAREWFGLIYFNSWTCPDPLGAPKPGLNK